MVFGAIRPSWDVEGGASAHSVGHCFYSTYDGRRFPGNTAWEGMQGVKQGGQGDRVGMLFDLDQGSMTVWKNDVRVGVMQADGLSGPLCCGVSVLTQGDSARIESGAAPPSPTEEEPAAAMAWQAAH